MNLEEQIAEHERTLKNLNVAITEIDLIHDRLKEEYHQVEEWLKKLDEELKLPNGSKHEDFEQ